MFAEPLTILKIEYYLFNDSHISAQCLLKSWELVFIRYDYSVQISV